MVWKNDQVSLKETEKIIEIAKEGLKVEGDFVEMGCYKGDTSLILAEILQHNAISFQKKRGFNTGNRVNVVENSVEKYVKKLWIYDSFQGLPEKTIEDEAGSGTNFQRGELFVSKKEVKARFLRAGLKVPMIKKAWFNELKEEDLPDKIAFAFLDGDFYESIRDSLRLIEGKISERGIIVVHDYTNEALPGVAKAVDEWAKGKDKQIIKFQSMAIIR